MYTVYSFNPSNNIWIVYLDAFKHVVFVLHHAGEGGQQQPVHLEITFSEPEMWKSTMQAHTEACRCSVTTVMDLC